MTSGIERPTAPRNGLDFAQTPLLVIWETTQACGLACRHCRADARDWRDPSELSTAEGFALLDRVAALGTKVCVLSGGDPLRRNDLEQLVEHGTKQGLRMCTIPAATALASPERMRSLRDAGLAKLAFSLDGAAAATHDGIRRIPGTFDRTLDAARTARSLGIDVQFNTLVCADNVEELRAIARIVEEIGADMWELMFLIPVGRGVTLQALGLDLCERAFEVIDAIEDRASFVTKVTEAPHYRRYRRERGVTGPMHRVNAGNGFVFISHVGDIFPSGFLPLRCGNVRHDDLVEVYRGSPVLRQLRDPDQLRAPCGTCDWRTLCGGSRSRAFAVTGDHLGAEPWCGLGARMVAASSTAHATIR